MLVSVRCDALYYYIDCTITTDLLVLASSPLPSIWTNTYVCPSPFGLHIDFWDTAGQERFSTMHPTYYHQAHACVLVFDVTRKITYKNLSNWYKELRQHRPDIPCVLVANKIDGEYV